MATPDEKMKQAKADEKRFQQWLYGLHLLAALILGFSFFPMIAFFYWVWKATGVYGVWVKLLAFSMSLGIGYFLFGTTLIFVCVLAKNVFRFRIEPGLYKIHAMESLRWMGYNSMILIANAAFLDVLRISPFQTLFYRLMGAKVGNGVNINTGGLADLSLLEIGDHVLVGGGTALICHASERGFIRLARTKLGNNVSIGINSVIMPDVEIGDGSTIAPCSFVPKGTRVPPRSYWGGNPVQDLRAQRRAELSKSDS